MRKGHDFAFTDAERRVVYLNPHNPGGVTPRTLWHELVHAMLEHTGWDADRIVGEEAEESVAYALEGTLHELLARNRRLAAYLAST